MYLPLNHLPWVFQWELFTIHEFSMGLLAILNWPLESVDPGLRNYLKTNNGCTVGNELPNIWQTKTETWSLNLAYNKLYSISDVKKIRIKKRIKHYFKEYKGKVRVSFTLKTPSYHYWQKTEDHPHVTFAGIYLLRQKWSSLHNEITEKQLISVNGDFEPGFVTQHQMSTSSRLLLHRD